MNLSALQTLVCHWQWNMRADLYANLLTLRLNQFKWESRAWMRLCGIGSYFADISWHSKEPALLKPRSTMRNVSGAACISTAAVTQKPWGMWHTVRGRTVLLTVMSEGSRLILQTGTPEKYTLPSVWVFGFLLDTEQSWGSWSNILMVQMTRFRIWQKLWGTNSSWFCVHCVFLIWISH